MEASTLKRRALKLAALSPRAVITGTALDGLYVSKYSGKMCFFKLKISFHERKVQKIWCADSGGLETKQNMLKGCSCQSDLWPLPAVQLQISYIFGNSFQKSPLRYDLISVAPFKEPLVVAFCSCATLKMFLRAVIPVTEQSTQAGQGGDGVALQQDLSLVFMAGR